MIINKLSAIALLLVGFAALGCYPSGPDFVEDFDVVYTTYDEDFDFQARNTYAMPDKIVIDVEIDRFGDTTFVYMKDKYAKPILDEIDRQMQDYGWTKVNVFNTPDMMLMPAAPSSTTYFADYWYCWWYGGWYPGWGWYYPPYYSVSSITTGSMIMVLTDPNDGNDSPIDQSRASWIGIGNGILTDYGNVDRALQAIQQSFEQSTYLNIN